VEASRILAELVEPLLIVRRSLANRSSSWHRRLLAIVRDDEVCQRLMTTPASARRGADPIAPPSMYRPLPQIQGSRGGI